MNIKLPFGLKDGKLVHISEVESGLKCDCVCPSCHSRLVANKGKIKVHYFAHHKKDCEHGFETSLHLAAKEILKKKNKIFVPDVFLELGPGWITNWMVSKGIELDLDDVRLETYHQGVIPDVLVFVQGKPLMIEITVTHKTDQKKIEKVRKQGISILEINLEHFERDFSLEYLKKEVIENVENKNWLLNIKAENAKKLAYEVSEKKEFNLYTPNPYCPIENYASKDSNFWEDHCSNCEYCVAISHEAGGLYDRRGSLVSTIDVGATVLCLGKYRIDSLDKLIQFSKRKK